MNIKELYKIFDEKFKKEVLPYIERKMPRSQLTEPIYYYIDNFHLRNFRSVLPILIGEIFETDRIKTLAIGAASEVGFYIALVQDDIIDNDKVRGLIQVAHKKYGVSKTLASADYCYSAQYLILKDLLKSNLSSQTLKFIFDNFEKSHERLYRSFLTEIDSAFNLKITRSQIKQIHLDKTVSGTNAIYCTAIAIENNYDSKLAKILKKYSEIVAFSGQIKNDIYDFLKYSKTRGFSDLRNGYINYVIWSLASEKGVNKESLKSIIQDQDNKKIMEMIKKYSIIEKIEKEMNKLVRSAIELVKKEKLPLKLKDLLITWANGNLKINK